MALPELLRRRAEREVLGFCERRIPAHVRGEIRLEMKVRGNSITIVERRPPWKVDFGPEWSTMPIAQIRYDETTQTWALYGADRNGRWHADYTDLQPTPDIGEVLAEIDRDPTGIFWG